MRIPALHRLRDAAYTAVAYPVVRSLDALDALLWSTDEMVDAQWELSWSDRDRTRWRRGTDTIDCYPFGDGYVATATVESRDATWQLTPGPLPLASALATVSVYRQYGITPQVDPDGRPFVAVDADGNPVEAFEQRDVDDEFQYVYLDRFRSIEEFPDFLDPDANLERAVGRMSRRRGRAVAGN